MRALKNLQNNFEYHRLNKSTTFYWFWSFKQNSIEITCKNFKKSGRSQLYFSGTYKSRAVSVSFILIIFDLDYYVRVSYVAQLCAGGFSIIIFGFWSLQIQHPLIGIKTFAIIAAAVFVALIPTFKSTKYALFQPTSSSS